MAAILLAGAVAAGVTAGQAHAAKPFDRCCFRYDIGGRVTIATSFGNADGAAFHGTYDLDMVWDQRGIYKVHGHGKKLFFTPIAASEAWDQDEDNGVSEAQQVLSQDGKHFETRYVPVACGTPRRTGDFHDRFGYATIGLEDAPSFDPGIEGGFSNVHHFVPHCSGFPMGFNEPPLNNEPDNSGYSFPGPPASWAATGTGRRAEGCLVRQYAGYGEGSGRYFVKGSRVLGARLTYVPKNKLRKWKKKLTAMRGDLADIDVVGAVDEFRTLSDVTSHPDAPFPPGLRGPGCRTARSR